MNLKQLKDKAEKELVDKFLHVSEDEELKQFLLDKMEEVSDNEKINRFNKEMDKLNKDFERNIKILKNINS